MRSNNLLDITDRIGHTLKKTSKLAYYKNISSLSIKEIIFVFNAEMIQMKKHNIALRMKNLHVLQFYL